MITDFSHKYLTECISIIIIIHTVQCKCCFSRHLNTHLVINNTASVLDWYYNNVNVLISYKENVIEFIVTNRNSSSQASLAQWMASSVDVHIPRYADHFSVARLASTVRTHCCSLMREVTRPSAKSRATYIVKWNPSNPPTRWTAISMKYAMSNSFYITESGQMEKNWVI